MGDIRFNERASLAWLVKVRVVVIAFLLAVELLIVHLTPNNVNIRYFETVIIAWFTVSFFFILLPRYWAYLTAAVSFICFGALLELTFFERIPSFQYSARGDLKSLQVVIAVNFCAYLAVAH